MDTHVGTTENSLPTPKKNIFFLTVKELIAISLSRSSVLFEIVTAIEGKAEYL